MKRLICFLAIILCILSQSCTKVQEWGKEKNCMPNFKIINTTKEKINLKIEIVDQNYKDTLKTYKEIFSKVINAEESFPIFSKDLKIISNSGKGYFFLSYSIENEKLKHDFRLRNYDKYSFSDDSYPGYNTFEISFIDKGTLPPPREKDEIKISFSKYRGETKLEGI